LALPVATSLSVSGVSLSAALLAVSAVAGFLAHEPLLILLGRRGLRVRREMHRVATTWFVATAGAATLLGIEVRRAPVQMNQASVT
jgi:hypothetical protein